MWPGGHTPEHPPHTHTHRAPPISLSGQWLQNFLSVVSIRNWRTPDGFFCYMKPVVLARFLLENTVLHPFHPQYGAIPQSHSLVEACTKDQRRCPVPVPCGMTLGPPLALPNSIFHVLGLGECHCGQLGLGDFVGFICIGLASTLVT